MSGYKFTEKAAADFARLYEYGLNTFGYKQAEQYTDDMEKRFSKLTTNPLLYPATDEILHGSRRSVFGVHSIYYPQC